MNLLGKNQKTTILGLLTIIGALVHAGVAHYAGQPVDLATLLAAVTSGVGLIMAKDSTTHSTAPEVKAATNEQAGV